MSYIKDVASIDVSRIVAPIVLGCIAGTAAAVPGSLAGVFIAMASLPGPVSGEIVMALPFLGGLGGAIIGLPCGTIGWFSCYVAGRRGWMLSLTLGVVVAALGAAVLYWWLIAPSATVPEHSVLITGVALTIGIGFSGAVSALVSRVNGLRWRSKTPTP